MSEEFQQHSSSMAESICVKINIQIYDQSVFSFQSVFYILLFGVKSIHNKNTW